jgi:hypothetical protein
MMLSKRYGTRGLRTAVAFWFIVSGGIGLGLTSSHGLAASHRHHAAHEHGVAHLNVALDGDHLYIEFSSPAANIVGFEHHPRTQKQKAAVADALKKLAQGKTLFLLSPESSSQMVAADVHTDIEHHADAHEKTGHTGEDAHHHAEKETHEHTGEHHEADENERHSDFKATYHFVCKKPKKLSKIAVRLFNIFPGIEHIQVQLLAGTKQTAMELTAKKHTISF